jgi:hypothetical protein
MNRPNPSCPDCGIERGVSRRELLKSAAIGAAALTAGISSVNVLRADDKTESKSSAESLVKVLYESMTPKQREENCFDWDYKDSKRGLLRTFVANNWNINENFIHGDYYTKDQQVLVRKIFEDLIRPEWHARVDKQLEDDAGGFGVQQSLAIFGKPGEGKFELVMTGRHMTMRCDGNSEPHVAFGGPIFYGHAPEGSEGAKHTGNSYWEQAIAANRVYEMLDGKQRKQAEVGKTPPEQSVAFTGKSGVRPGIPLSEMSKDQVAEVQKVLAKLLEPYRQGDQDEAKKCLDAQGGLEKCSLAFYTDNDIGGDRVWDNWRLEGPSFVWYFRGAPHVHVWVNIADDPSVKLNA